MKRILLSAIGIGALVLAVPGSALAHRGHETVHHHNQTVHHHRHHHKAHRTRVRILHLHAGSASTSPPAGTPGSAAPGTGSNAGNPGNPARPADAGTVVSFANGVLTIKLGDESTVSGAVTTRTEIECVGPATPPTATTADDHGSRGPGDGRGVDRSGPGGRDAGRDNEDNNNDENDDNDNDGDHHEGQRPVCDTTALVIGAVVHAAELRISSTGAVFTNIRLAR